MSHFFVGVAVGLFFGWLHAHNHIAAECERLGGFFVGKRIYHCERIERPTADTTEGASGG